MADAASCTHSRPSHLDEALELAEIMEPTWSALSAGLRASGTPLCEGEVGGDGGEGGGGDGGGEEAPGGGAGGGGGEPTITAEEEAIIAKAENPDAVRKLITGEREARRTAEQKASAEAAKVKEHEDAKKSVEEKLADENTVLKTKSTTVEAENMRLRVAIDKKLPTELIDRLQGDTKEQLEADADKLLGLLGEGEDDPPNFEGGAAGRSSSGGSPDDLIRNMRR